MSKTTNTYPQPPPLAFSIPFPILLLLLLLLPIPTQSQCPHLGCQTCLNTQHCESCFSGFRLRNDLVCEACADWNCKSCHSAGDKCDRAKSGYGVVWYRVWPCAVADCGNCDGDIYRCLECRSGYRLNGLVCEQCVVGHCNKCPNSANQCTLCHPTRHLASPSQCQTPNLPNCIYATSPSFCQTCFQGFAYEPTTSSCQPCQLDFCINCDTNLMICQACGDLHGVDLMGGTGACTRCDDAKCVLCSENSFFCTMCVFEVGYGPDTVGRCSPCADSNCYLCDQNATKCKICNYGYGVNSTFQCSSCQDPNCYDCTTSYNYCTQCLDLYGFNSNRTCQTCIDTRCINCSSNINTCTECNPGYYSFLGTCQPCSAITPNCLTCQQTSPPTCLTCSSPFYLSPFSPTCEPCPQFCTLCELNNTTLTPYCTQCNDNQTGVSYLLENGLCVEILCGDLQVGAGEECDNQVGWEYDGCTDGCGVEDGFVCADWVGLMGTPCSYTRRLEMELVKFQGKQDGDGNPLNEFQIQIKIFPPLHIITLLNQNRPISTIFFLTSPPPTSLAPQSLTYNPQTSTLTLTCKLLSSLPSSSTITMQFLPQKHYSQFFFFSHTPNSTLSISMQGRGLYFVKELDRVVRKIGLWVCYGAVGVGWVAVGLGVWGRRLAGIQAVVVGQVVWMGFLMFAGEMIYPFEQVHPLKYFNGYNHNFSPEQQKQKDIQAPYYKIFGFSKQIFANNFNICMAVQLLSLFYLTASRIRLSKFFRNKTQKQLQTLIREEQVNQTNQQNLEQRNWNKQKYRQNLEKFESKRQAKSLQRRMNDLVFHYEFSLQILMTFCVLNLMYFVTGLILYLENIIKTKEKVSGAQNIVSLVIICIQFIIFAFTFVKFIIDPSPFDYFRFSFRKSEPAMRYYLLYLIYIISIPLSILLSHQQPYPYIPVIPPAVMLIVTAAYRPYKTPSENIRSCWCYLVCIAVMLWRVYYAYWHKEGDGTAETVAVGWFIGIVFGMLPITVGIAVVVGLVNTYKYCKKNFQTKQLLKKKQQQLTDYRKKLLIDLVRTDPNKKLQQTRADNTFRELMKPQVSMLKATNLLRLEKDARDGSDGTEQREGGVKGKGKLNGDQQEFRMVELRNLYESNKINIDNKLVNKNINEEYISIKKPVQKQLEPLKIKSQKPIYRHIFNQHFDYKQLNINFDVHEQAQVQAQSPTIPQPPKHPTPDPTPDPTPTQSEKSHMVASIVRDESKYINLQSAINITKGLINEPIEEELIEEYEKIEV